MNTQRLSQLPELVRRNSRYSMLRALPILSIASALFAAGSSAVLAYGQIAVRNQGYVPFSDAPINYRTAELHDPVAALQQQLNSGKASLQYEPEHGYLRSVLQLLSIPIDSQTLVFSKTSFQYKKISPDHPRALYFNDDVYVGSVHDGKAIEIVSFDPLQGAVFYLLDEHKVDKPVFQRAELDCTQCHIAAGTRGVPGVLLRSIYSTTTGVQANSTPAYITDQESPFKERWGGWYVTGKVGSLASMANAAVPDPSDPASPAISQFAPVSATKLVALDQPFDPSTYLIPDSDVVAQLVLAHQTQMHNLITLTNYKTRIALYAAATQNKAAGQPADAALPDDLRLQFERPAEQLLRYLLFVNETALPGSASSSIVGSSTFTRTFAARGTHDADGRSLRDFDLHTRIFKYPCSYLIYTDSFDQIPEPARSYIYHRLFEILTEKDQSQDFAKISAADKRAIFEILLATKPGLPTEWNDYARSNHLRVAATPTPRNHPDQIALDKQLHQIHTQKGN